MRPFKVLDRGAEGGLAFEASGKDLSVLFMNAGKGLEGLMLALSTVKKTTDRKVNLQAENSSELLFKFLASLVVMKDAYNMVFSGFEINVAGDGKSLSGVLKGEIIDKKRHKLKMKIKTLSQRRFKLARKDGGWAVEAILDV